MAITEALRHRIHEAFRASHGDEVANGLMEMLPPVGWAEVATKHDLAALEQRIGGRFEALEARMEGRFQALDGRFDAIDGRFQALDGRFDAIDGRFQALDGRSDGRFQALDGRFQAVDWQFEAVGERFNTLEASMRAALEAQTVRYIRWLVVIAAFTVGAAEALSRVG